MAKSKKVSQGKYHIVMMCCGYVESSMTSWLIFSTMDKGDKFKTAGEAIVELALDLHAKYEDEQSHSRGSGRKCCENTKSLHSQAKFCMGCGHRLDDGRFDELGFVEFVKDLHVRNCDAFGESECAGDRDFVFWPWRAEEIVGASKDEIVLLSENAEGVILSALYEAKPELRDSEFASECACDADWAKVKAKGTNHST